ncbi:MAG: type II 3-dehydroquinate dehydratase [Clostridiales bacterium]|nr:type II 3-dehydroquinate dehydratase [Candidatus Crickella equi]
MKILVINGPNMNMLGVREPEIYGAKTYDDLLSYIKAERGSEHELDFFQSNIEGEIVDAIQKAYYDKVEGIVINPAAYTHTSIAILDALKAVGIPCVEVHISDVDEREEYRKISYVREVAIATISGHGFDGYIEAIDMLSSK